MSVFSNIEQYFFFHPLCMNHQLYMGVYIPAHTIQLQHCSALHCTTSSLLVPQSLPLPSPFIKMHFAEKGLTMGDAFAPRNSLFFLSAPCHCYVPCTPLAPVNCRERIAKPELCLQVSSFFARGWVSRFQETSYWIQKKEIYIPRQVEYKVTKGNLKYLMHSLTPATCPTLC